ncbi:MAG: 3'-5' exonuclease domain-containing protein 2, partial [Bacteroidia bacterium]|nr:3'-5' exonuclease domain-containing protein 2 [Bacteroidia bacterium]
MGLSISKEKVAELPLANFGGKIVIVEHLQQIQNAIHNLSQFSELGFDTETKPAFKRGQVNKVALLQLSTWEV